MAAVSSVTPITFRAEPAHIENAAWFACVCSVRLSSEMRDQNSCGCCSGASEFEEVPSGPGRF